MNASTNCKCLETSSFSSNTSESDPLKWASDSPNESSVLTFVVFTLEGSISLSLIATWLSTRVSSTSTTTSVFSAVKSVDSLFGLLFVISTSKAIFSVSGCLSCLLECFSSAMAVHSEHGVLIGK